MFGSVSSEGKTVNCQKCHTPPWRMLERSVNLASVQRIRKCLKRIAAARIALDLMADRIQRARIEAPKLQGDPSVWSAIRYLDSPTDYRECLPVTDRDSSVPERKLLLLDDLPQFVRVRLWTVTIIAIVVCVILLASLRS